MKTFKDSQDRTWEIAITIGSVMRVKDRLGVDLLKPEDGTPPLITRLATDELLLAEVICCLLERQFDAHQVSQDDVRDAFDGKTLTAAQEAFYDDLVDFFLGRGRKDQVEAVAKMTKAKALAVKIAKEKVDAIDLESEIRGMMSGSSPEPSASIRDD